MTAKKSNSGLLAFALLLGFAAVWQLQKGIDLQLAAMHREQDELTLRSGRLLKALSLEYAPFLADVYWTRAVQYYGDKRVRHDVNFELLSPLLDLTTTLDPNLVVAYRFGALFLAEPPPRGAGRPDQAVTLIRRGIENNPEYWRFWQDLGFIYYWELRDTQKASEAFLEGSKNPKADVWMKVMAAKVAEEGQSRATSMFLWRQVYDSTTDPQIQKNAFNHLQMLKAEQDREQLDAVIAQFFQRFNRLPQSLGDLVAAGIFPGVPVDPEGYPYVLGPDGKTQLNPKSPLAADQKNPSR